MLRLLRSESAISGRNCLGIPDMQSEVGLRSINRMLSGMHEAYTQLPARVRANLNIKEIMCGITTCGETYCSL